MRAFLWVALTLGCGGALVSAVSDGDALKAEIRKYDERRFLDRLTTLGRLLASIRSLDLRLDDDEEVPRKIDEFFEGGHTFLRH